MNNEYYKRIFSSDFFVTDEKLTHRIVGLKWIRGIDVCPAVSYISSPIITEFVLEKQLIFSLGKKFYKDNIFSARLTHYNIGEFLDGDLDLESAASLYAIYL